MALKTIIGLDHIVIVVRDLDAAAVAWSRLGFTVSPRGAHSGEMGTGNHTIILGPDYIELLGVLRETALNAPTRAFLGRQGEGIERVAFTTKDAAAGVKELKDRGLAGIGPLDFGRPVVRPDGSQAEAKFRTFLWPIDEAPAGIRLFACQHLTRDAVWMPELQRHPNTAQRLLAIEIVAPDPQAEAQHMQRLIDEEARAEPGGVWRVRSGEGRADFVFLPPQACARRHPGMAFDLPPQRGAGAILVEVTDIETAARHAGATTVVDGDTLRVPAASANGVIVQFVGR